MEFPGTARRLALPVAVWGAHFAIVYGVTSFACARASPQAVPWAIGLATLAAGTFMVVTMAREWPRRDDFVAWLALALAAIALVAIVWEALPVLMVPACA
jgi:uncharacterized membrane protein HdeD (DUF308 family)